MSWCPSPRVWVCQQEEVPSQHIENGPFSEEREDHNMSHVTIMWSSADMSSSDVNLLVLDSGVLWDRGLHP